MGATPDDEGDWLDIRGDMLLVLVKVMPGSAVTCLAGLRGGRLLFRVAAPPEKGKANAALESFLSKMLGIPKNRISIVTGTSDRRKTVSLPAECIEALRSLMYASGSG